MAEPVALAALAIDAACGWPASLYARIGHPVGGFARLINACEATGNRPDLREKTRKITGICTILLVVFAGAGTAWIAEYTIRQVLDSYAWFALALLAWPALAQRSLDDHVRPIALALEGGDLAQARQAVAQIVGRDTATLDEPAIARAAIESLAESFCDGVVALFFWLLALGLPGLWAYKGINTADSLIGHREPRWRAFGWASARLDDLANLIPARLAGILLCIAGGGGWRTMWRDARLHASPNAGWPEAAMAGALDLRLAGPIAYDGVVCEKPWIGTGRTAATGSDIRRALRLYRRACLLLWLIAGGAAWAL